MSFNHYHPLWSVPFGKLDPQLGRDQRYFFRAMPFERLLPLLRPPKGGTMYVMTYDYSTNDLSNKAIKWFRKFHKSCGLNIRLIGGSPKDISHLQNLEDEGIVVPRIIPESPTTHIVVLDNPRQMWFEGYHKKGAAYNNYLTTDPYKDSWRAAMSACKEIWDEGQSLSSLEKILRLQPAI